MPQATLADVLAARDARAARQQALRAQYAQPLISYTLNIAGPDKADAYARAAYGIGRDRLLSALRSAGVPVLHREERAGAAGYEMLLAAEEEAERIKRLCVSLEEADALGRLFDMDVIAPDGAKLARAGERGCLVCGKPGRACAARRLHPVESVKAATRAIIRAACLQSDGEALAAQAVRALLDEVCVTPKPGLVDRLNAGSHRDMDIFTFNASASALYPYFNRCFLAGAEDAALAGAEAFAHLQALGIAAEGQMYAATNGVNTHKGAVFTLGVLCGAAGRVWQVGKRPDVACWLNACRELTAHYLAPGAREEMARGLPSVRDIGLPALRRAREAGLSYNDRALSALLRLIASVRDTNMLARGGAAAAEAARARVREALDAAGDSLLPPPCALLALDQYFMDRNLSPGGCADLLAATLLIDAWSNPTKEDTP